MKIYFAGKMPVVKKFLMDREETDLHLFDLSEEDELWVRTYEKITDWRWEITPKLEASLVWVPRQVESDPDHLEYATGERQRDFTTIGGHEYGGPFYRMEYDGHGIYRYKSDVHGHGGLDSYSPRPLTTQEIEANELYGADIRPLTKEERLWGRKRQTFSTCAGDIRLSDVVFTWVEDFDLFGTFCELGMAYAWGKPVIIASPKALPCKEEIWFPLESATYRIEAETAGEAFKDFLINYAPKIATDIATRNALETEAELNSLKKKISQIGEGRSAAWRELIKELK